MPPRTAERPRTDPMHSSSRYTQFLLAPLGGLTGDKADDDRPSRRQSQDRDEERARFTFTNSSLRAGVLRASAARRFPVAPRESVHSGHRVPHSCCSTGGRRRARARRSGAVGPRLAALQASSWESAELARRRHAREQTRSRRRRAGSCGRARPSQHRRSGAGDRAAARRSAASARPSRHRTARPASCSPRSCSSAPVPLLAAAALARRRRAPLARVGVLFRLQSQAAASRLAASTPARRAASLSPAQIRRPCPFPPLAAGPGRQRASTCSTVRPAEQGARRSGPTSRLTCPA